MVGIVLALIMVAPVDVQAKTVKQTKYFDMNEQTNLYTFPKGIAKAKHVKVKSSNPKVMTAKYMKHKTVGKTIKYVAKKAGTTKVTISYKVGKKQKKYIYTYRVIGKNKDCKSLGKKAFKIQNKYRTDKGLKKLEWSDELYEFGLYRIKKHGFDKHLNLRQDEKDYFGSFGAINVISFGENLAPCGEDASEAMKMWKNSSGHYKNIMKKDYKAGAIAYYKGTWVAIFSREEASLYKGWKDVDNSIKAIHISRINSANGKPVVGSVIQYYEKDDRWNTTKTKSINLESGVTIYLEVGKTYIIKERDTPSGVDEFEKIEIKVDENCPSEIILK